MTRVSKNTQIRQLPVLYSYCNAHVDVLLHRPPDDFLSGQKGQVEGTVPSARKRIRYY